jgi:hypothetical protein
LPSVKSPGAGARTAEGVKRDELGGKKGDSRAGKKFSKENNTALYKVNK